MKRFKEYTEEPINEAKFTRLPKQLNAMWNLKNSVESMVSKHDNGDDYDPKQMKTIEEFIKEIKKSAKDFKSKEEVSGTVYESNMPADNETYFRFLTVLRDSGKTNMFGAAPYLQQVFDLSKSEARKVLAEWMKSFNESIVNETKIAFINTGLISERIQKSGLLPLLGKNNVSLNKDKMDFTKELSSTLTKLYKKYSSLPVK